MASESRPESSSRHPEARASGLLPEQPVEAVVQLYLGQEPLGVCGCSAGRIGCVAVEYEFGGVEQKLFRGRARMHSQQLQPGALIEVEANVHILNLSVPHGGFNRTVVTICGDFPKVKHAGAAPIGNTADGLDLNGGGKRL
jgi:hypothetical protein